jgi:hypothetical protein
VIKNSCNCTTCKYAPDRGIANNLCPIATGDQHGEFPSDAIERITKIVGCMLHHQAREYLMKDILEELERRKTDLNLALDRPILGTQMKYQNIATMEEEVEMLDEITNLIKNGVEKK